MKQKSKRKKCKLKGHKFEIVTKNYEEVKCKRCGAWFDIYDGCIIERKPPKKPDRKNEYLSFNPDLGFDSKG